MKEVVRKNTNCGVTVIVTARNDSFDVAVSVKPKTVLCQKISNEFFRIKFCLGNYGNVAKEAICFELKEKQYNEKALYQNFKTKLTLNCGIVCTISLAPSFYLSKLLLQKRKKMKKSKKNKNIPNLVIGHETIGSFKWNGKGKAPYSKTNLAKPYQGGLCTPK